MFLYKSFCGHVCSFLLHGNSGVIHCMHIYFIRNSLAGSCWWPSLKRGDGERRESILGREEVQGH